MKEEPADAFGEADLLNDEDEHEPLNFVNIERYVSKDDNYLD